MAFLKCSHASASLEHRVTFNAIIPDNADSDITTLYLLHGLGDNEDGWSSLTMIEYYARERNMAVIMPNGSTSFYTDTKNGNEKYFTYVSTELVDYTRRLFRLSTKREKTFIGGNSMGGYGAVKIALSRPDVFGGALTLSGALDIVNLSKNADWFKSCAVRAWGDDHETTLKGSDSDLFALLDKANSSRSPKPRIIQICGTEDFLYEDNQTFRRYIEKTDFDYKYIEDEGTHDWPFWNKYITVGMDLLLEK